MQIRLGYELVYDCPQPTPMILMLNIHQDHRAEIVVPDRMITSPAVAQHGYIDSFGNWCTRILAPAGQIKISTSALVNTSPDPDIVAPWAGQTPVELLPDDTLQYLLGSRYCETDRLSDIAWKLFERTPPGWKRVQAICDFVHRHITFGYEHARATKTAREAYDEGKGVCRDYAHLAITFCRCMNIPARYCTGYLSDIGTPKPWAAGDFAGWFEAYLGGSWHMFDPRNNTPRIGRVLIAQGRDASDVPITQTFGPNKLLNFKVWTDEVV
jgi:transglutaminase-like putative cysteine protease